MLQVQKKMKDRNITIVQFEAWVQVKMFKKYKSLDQLFISFFWAALLLALSLAQQPIRGQLKPIIIQR